jgi:hypothetical protein
VHTIDVDNEGEPLMTAVYVEAVTDYTGDLPSVFLAGGITGCPDWQATAFDALADLPVAVFNPRRKNFPIHDPSASAEQIAWEHRHLQRADVALFWFPASGPVVQPIALYELGRYASLVLEVAVGADPAYVRRQDVEIQMQLARPDIAVHDTLTATVTEARRLLQVRTVKVAG